MKDPNPCKCIIKVNESLEPKGAALTTGFSLSGMVWPLLRIEQLKSQRPANKITLACAYCPFCGVELKPKGAARKTAPVRPVSGPTEEK